MRSYRNSSQDLIGGFEELKFNLIPRLYNYIANSLATSATGFKVPMYPRGRYEIEVRNMPSIPDNMKICKVIEDNKKIQEFLSLIEEFYGLSIEEENDLLEKDTLTQEPLQIQTIVPKEIPREEDIAPLEYVDAGEAEEAWEIEMQETDEK